MEMFYSDEEKRVFELFPNKSKEELIAELELSMEHGGDMEKEVFGGLIQKLKQELAGE